MGTFCFIDRGWGGGSMQLTSIDIIVFNIRKNGFFEKNFKNLKCFLILFFALV